MRMRSEFSPRLQSGISVDGPRLDCWAHQTALNACPSHERPGIALSGAPTYQGDFHIAARGAIPNKARLGALSESSTQNPPLSGTAQLRPRIAAGLVLMPTSGNQRRLAWARRKATIPSCIPVGWEVGRFSNDFRSSPDV